MTRSRIRAGIALCAVALVAAAPSVRAAAPPSARALRQEMTGALVLVKLDMPATSRGLEVWPDRSNPIDEKLYLARIKDGIALHAGETTWVSDIRVSSKSIDVLFGGGGYNYIMDAGAMAAAGHPVKEKSQEQLQLETDIMKSASGNGQEMEALGQRMHDRNELERQRLSGDRSGDGGPAVAKTREEMAGSRFTIRFPGSVPPEKMSAAFIIQALAEYVEFLTAAPPASSP